MPQVDPVFIKKLLKVSLYVPDVKTRPKNVGKYCSSYRRANILQSCVNTSGYNVK